MVENLSLPFFFNIVNELILSISYVNVAFENVNFLEATGGKQKTEGIKPSNFGIEEMEVQRAQDT